MTVGAVDLGGTIGGGNEAAAPWSAYGYTYDGFAKPDIGPPGRYMVGPVPPTSSLVAWKPLNETAPGYMQLSGTSFAAPVVAGAAQQLLLRHPSWTPYQIKGALLATSRKAPNAIAGSIGAGELNAGKASALSSAPNANLALDKFLVPDPKGGSTPVFDWATWEDAVKRSTAWDAATWTDATWTDATWTDATWTDAALEDATWTDSAEGDASPSPSAYLLDASDKTAILADPYITPPPG